MSETLPIVSHGTTLALLQKVTHHADLRGSVAETYRASWFPEVPTVKQLVQSNSKPKTLRGMHLHRQQWDIWRFVSDEALVRLYDHERRGQALIRADKSVVLAIPPGISHGFVTQTGCVLVYALTEEYTGADEFGWYPFDGLPNFWMYEDYGFSVGLVDEIEEYRAISSHGDWPTNHANLNMSERDLRAPRLSDFAASGNAVSNASSIAGSNK